jgi:micrococcal nuclease
LLLCLALCAGSACAHQVVGIADGDTLTVLRNRKPVKVRLSDIDAPEKRQPFGARAKQTLSDMCFGKDATLSVRNKDRYGRVVARVSCDGVDVNRAQVERGMAWHYRRYSKDKALAVIQDQARVARRGLWADPAPVPPWTFRRK